MMWFHYPYWMGGWGWIFMVVGGLLALVFFIGLIVWAVRGGRSRSDMSYKEKTPEEILKKRYAKGEINKEQYEEMKSTLGS